MPISTYIQTNVLAQQDWGTMEQAVGKTRMVEVSDVFLIKLRVRPGLGMTEQVVG